MKKILVIAAHPDDEVLGCGGTIARYVKTGHQVSVVILGEGITSRDAKRLPAQRKKDISGLKQQVRRANALLGTDAVSFFNLPDNRFDSLDLLDIVKRVEEHVADTRPDIIFTHSGCDLNIDHTITHRAVLTATRPVPGHFVKEIYTFEVPSSTEWAFNRLLPSFRPNVFIDIADTLDVKLSAMKLYELEARQFPHPRSSEAIAALAGYRGSTVGIEAAEAFELVRKTL